MLCVFEAVFTVNRNSTEYLCLSAGCDTASENWRKGSSASSLSSHVVDVERLTPVCDWVKLVGSVFQFIDAVDWMTERASSL